MKPIALAAAILCLLHASPTLAEEAVMSRPIQAGSLHEGPLDMVAYWTSTDGRHHEMTATFLARTEGAAPMRTVMALADGDEVSFGMPGHRGVLYGFARRGTDVFASVQVSPQFLAGN